METKEIQADKNDKLQEVHVEMIRSDFHKFRKGEKGCADIKTTVRYVTGSFIMLKFHAGE